MAMEYFCCYNDYLTKTRNLSDSELGRLFRALMTYSATGEKAQLNGREGMAFDFISIDIDTAKERYSAKCEQNKANKRQRSSTDDNDRQRTITDVPQEKRKKKEEKDISFVSNDTQDIGSAKSARGNHNGVEILWQF